MTYSDSIGDNAQLLRRTVTGVTDFSGRSRRTEVIYYWIASTLAGVVLDFAASTVISFQTSLLFGDVLQLALLIPMFALFVRRLHDQNKSSWWGVLLPLAICLSIPERVTELQGDVQAVIAQKTTPVAIMAGLCGLAIFVLCLLPGSEGANRYGPDPRLEDA
jgi:uncharacterized membrane protein YhaH (DUF805 family)